MSESNNKIPFSTIRREIRKLMHSPRQKGPAFPAVEFMPCDLKIWTGQDSDFFRRSFCHHRMILKVILAGNVSTHIDGIRYFLNPMDAVLYFPMQTHSTQTRENGEFEYLAISFIAGMGHYEALNVLRNRVLAPELIAPFLPEIIRAWNQNRSMRAACLLAELLSFAVWKISGMEPGGEEKEGGKFGNIASYIRENCRNDLSVKKIASQFDISPQSVRRIFRGNLTGLTPGELIRQQKMILAEELLRRTDLPLQEIAGQCGFSTAFSFSRAFRRQYGIPPGLYRKNHS